MFCECVIVCGNDVCMYNIFYCTILSFKMNGEIVTYYLGVEEIYCFTSS